MKNISDFVKASTIARLLIEHEAVHFDVEHPFEYVSGIISPVYVDNRKLISYPEARKLIVNYFCDILISVIGHSNFDIVAGTATAGIPWASWVAEKLDSPLIYVRQKAKGRGMDKQIEGVMLPSQKAVVIEDLITTGLSSTGVAESIRIAGGEVSNCVTIFSFDLPVSQEKFQALGLSVHSLTSLPVLLDTCREMSFLRSSEIDSIEKWYTSTLNLGRG